MIVVFFFYFRNMDISSDGFDLLEDVIDKVVWVNFVRMDFV